MAAISADPGRAEEKFGVSEIGAGLGNEPAAKFAKAPECALGQTELATAL